MSLFSPYGSYDLCEVSRRRWLRKGVKSHLSHRPVLVRGWLCTASLSECRLEGKLQFLIISISDGRTHHGICIRRMLRHSCCVCCTGQVWPDLRYRWHTKIPRRVGDKLPIPRALESWGLSKCRLGLSVEWLGDVCFSSSCWLVSSRSNSWNLFSHRCMSMALLPDTWLAASQKPHLKHFEPGLV